MAVSFMKLVRAPQSWDICSCTARSSNYHNNKIRSTFPSR